MDDSGSKPNNAGDHFVTDLNYQELVALAYCIDCEWTENYHPCINTDTPEEKARCADHVAQYNKSHPSSAAKKGSPCSNPPTTSYELEQLHPKVNETQVSGPNKGGETLKDESQVPGSSKDDETLKDENQVSGPIEGGETLKGESQVPGPSEADKSLNDKSQVPGSSKDDETLKDENQVSGPNAGDETLKGESHVSGPSDDDKTSKDERQVSPPTTLKNDGASQGIERPAEVRDDAEEPGNNGDDKQSTTLESSSQRNSLASSAPSSARSSMKSDGHNSQRTSDVTPRQSKSHHHYHVTLVDVKDDDENKKEKDQDRRSKDKDRRSRDRQPGRSKSGSSIAGSYQALTARSSIDLKALESVSRRMTKSFLDHVQRMSRTHVPVAARSSGRHLDRTKSRSVVALQKKSDKGKANSRTSLPASRTQSENDVIHHAIFDQTDFESADKHNSIDSNSSESPKEEESNNPDGSQVGNNVPQSDDQPPPRASPPLKPKRDSKDIPDRPLVTDSIFDDLVALGRCSDCKWKNNYHPCFAPGVTELGIPSNCEELNFGFYIFDDEDDLKDEDIVAAFDKYENEFQPSSKSPCTSTQPEQDKATKSQEEALKTSEPDIMNATPDALDNPSASAQPQQTNAAVESSPGTGAGEDMPPVGERKDSDGEREMMILVSKSTYQELLATGKVLNKFER